MHLCFNPDWTLKIENNDSVVETASAIQDNLTLESVALTSSVPPATNQRDFFFWWCSCNLSQKNGIKHKKGKKKGKKNDDSLCYASKCDSRVYHHAPVCITCITYKSLILASKTKAQSIPLMNVRCAKMQINNYI